MEEQGLLWNRDVVVHLRVEAVTWGRCALREARSLKGCGELCGPGGDGSSGNSE